MLNPSGAPPLSSHLPRHQRHDPVCSVLPQDRVRNGCHRLDPLHRPAAPAVGLFYLAGIAEGAEHGDVVLTGLALDAVHPGIVVNLSLIHISEPTRPY